MPNELPNDSIASTNVRPPSLTTAGLLARLAAIGGLIIAVAVPFAYLGGWLTPHDLTPARFVDAFEQVDGIHSGFRRNHAKGLCVSGFFESNGQGARLSKAAVFKPGRVPVIGRFSFGGGQPYVADAPDAVRGLGLLFTLPDGEEWRTAMVNLPVFLFNSPQGFYDRLVSSMPDPKTGKPDPDKMKDFAAKHPETARALKIVKSHPVSSRFDNSTFNSLNAFRFVDAADVSIPVRWSMVPLQPFAAADTAKPAPDNKNYMFDALIAHIARQPLQWRMMVTVGQSGDPTNDATVAWPDGREQVDVGTLTLEHAESEQDSPARDLNFDPLILPAGIVPSDDPLLSARSAIYSQAFTRRAGETKEPSAITNSDLHKGR